MTLAFVPTLRIQRELYNTPPGEKRFKKYLDTMTGGTDDVILPLMAMNPMAKPHVAARLDAWLAMDADAVAADAVADAVRRLGRHAANARVTLVIADDVAGGWTDRALTDAGSRFHREAEAKRGWAVGLLWASETPTPALARQTALATAYRAAHQARFGAPGTLAECMRQEGRVMRFASIPSPLEPAALDAARSAIAPHHDSTVLGVHIACFYGDEAADRAGHARLGVPPGGAFAVALSASDDPIAALG